MQNATPIHVRLDETDKKYLAAVAQRCGLTPAALARKFIVEGLGAATTKFENLNDFKDFLVDGGVVPSLSEADDALRMTGRILSLINKNKDEIDIDA